MIISPLMKMPWPFLAAVDRVHYPFFVPVRLELFSCLAILACEVCVDEPVEVRDVELKNPACLKDSRNFKEDFLNLKKSKVFEHSKHKNAVNVPIRKRQAATIADNVHKMAIAIIDKEISVDVARLRVRTAADLQVLTHISFPP